ncbi:MAG: TIGR02186 family protein [Alphaproteobacteria bacterium]
MRPGAVIAAFLLCAAWLPASAEEVTIAVSSPVIKITSNFTGADIAVFGVMEDVAAKRDYDVIVTLRGPPQNVAVRRKDRVLGIWINRASETVLAAPGFYALQSSSELWRTTGPKVRQDFLLGTEHLGFVHRGQTVVNDPAANEFRRAFLRLKEEEGLYSESLGVSFIGDAIFRATIALPGNIPAGRYLATAYLFAAGDLLATAQETVGVTRVGAERFLFDLSRNQSLIYGFAAVILALFVGWLGGVLFRRD